MSTVHLPELIAETWGTSRSEGRRLISQGAVFIDDKQTIALDLPRRDILWHTLRLGRRREKVITDRDLPPVCKVCGDTGIVGSRVGNDPQTAVTDDCPECNQ